MLLMVEFLKHSVLICRMACAQSSHCHHRKLSTFQPHPHGSVVQAFGWLDYKEGWLTLMFPGNCRNDQWLKDPFPDHSPPQHHNASNQWYSYNLRTWNAPGTHFPPRRCSITKQLDYCLWLQLSYKPTEAGTPHNRPACGIILRYYVCKPMTQGSRSLQVCSL